MGTSYFKIVGKASQVATCEVLRDCQEALVELLVTASTFKYLKQNTCFIDDWWLCYNS